MTTCSVISIREVFISSLDKIFSTAIIYFNINYNTDSLNLNDNYSLRT